MFPYLIYSGRSYDIPMGLLYALILSVGGSIMFTYLICVIKFFTNNTFEYELIACKWNYETEKELLPISDDVIVNYIRNKYNFLIISIANAITPFIYTKQALDLEYIIKLLIIYIILRVLFLNKILLKKDKLFIKYRNLFPYKEKDLEESKSYLKTKLNYFFFISIILIFLYSNGKNISLILLIYVLSIIALSKIIDRIYKN